MNTYRQIVDKYRLVIGRQHVVEIPDMDREDMAKLFYELGFRTGAEIGTWKGEYAEMLCKHNPDLHLYGVDPWQVSVYEPEEIKAGVTVAQEQYDEYYQRTLRRLSPYDFTAIRKTSMEALKDFADNSLDFVYIDANHDFVNFTNDLHFWIKKVRYGGIISGHDFAYFPYHKFIHVKRALLAYARCYLMIPLFIVGAEAVGDGRKRDPFRSWFWVKAEV